MDFHHAVPGLSRVADGADEIELLKKDLIHRKLNFLSADPHLRVTSHGSQGVDTTRTETLVGGTIVR